MKSKQKLIALLLSGTMLFGMAAPGSAGAVTPEEEHGTPYGGVARTIPGTIEAEEFNEGANNVAYYDTTPGNKADQPAGIRTDTDVDIENIDGNATDLCWTDTGEWLKYTVNVEPGRYNISAYTASGGNSGSLTFFLDDQNLGTLTTQNTGAWNNWTKFTLNNVELTGGENQILKMQINGPDVNIDRLEFEKLPDHETPITGISLDKTEVTAGIGQLIPLWSEITPDDATNPTLTWTSDHPEIASVNANGMVNTLAAGTAVITASNADKSVTAQCTVTVEEGAHFQAPYKGKTHVMPGKFEAEDFDEGGDGYAYHDTEAQNLLGGYRLDEGVDIVDQGEEHNIGWVTGDGEWLEYTVNFSESGPYRFIAHVSSYLDAPGKLTGILNISVDGQPIGSVDLKNQTTGFYDFQDFIIDNVIMEKGDNKVVRIDIENGNCNFDWFGFERIYTAQELADKITSLENPEKDAVELTLPEMPDGASVAIKSSSNEDVVALDGTIVPPAADTPVTLVLTVTKDGETADTIPLTITVPAETSAAELAKEITEITTPAPDAVWLTMPKVSSKYFKVSIFSSSRKDVIGLGGRITPPEEDTEVELVFAVTSKNNPANTANTVPLKVTVPKKTVDTDSVTMIAFGDKFIVPGTGGDTWDLTWGADDKIYMQHNDGNGFSYSWDPAPTVHSRVMSMEGTPEDPSSIKGQNLNQGSLSDSLGTDLGEINSRYSTGIYEVDGALYFIPCHQGWIPNVSWKFYDSSLFKSTDGGQTWMNHLGEIDTLPSQEECLFGDDDASDLSFVKYGKGGEAPAIDNAENYVYLVSPSGCYGYDYYLLRISREALKNWTSGSFDASNVEYYTGGDGMLDENWSTDSSKKSSIYHDTYGESIGYARCSPANIVYNPTLGRYFMVSQNSDGFANPVLESTLYAYEAPHPWGPWTLVLEENVQYKDASNLTWPYLSQKFQSEDGKKMWMTVTGSSGNPDSYGRNEYALNFKPVYLTTEPVSTYEAEDAGTLSGVMPARAEDEFEGSGYVEGFDAAGDKISFKVNAEKAGAYILKFRYRTDDPQKLTLTVNDTYQGLLRLGRSEQKYTNWTEITAFAWLNQGDNDVSVSMGFGDTGNVLLDNLKVALYSEEEGSLPNCTPTQAEQSPYNGQAAELPETTIKAADFDKGGQNVAYYEYDEYDRNWSGYRTDDAGIDVNGEGKVTDLYDGEWMEYTVNIPAGRYDFTVKAMASNGNGDIGQISLLLDDQLIETEDAPVAGQGWQDVKFRGVEVADNGGSTHVLKVYVHGRANLSLDTISAEEVGDPVPVTGVTLNHAEVEMGLTQTVQLQATIEPENATNPDVTWDSDNDAVATVDSRGKVSAVGEGQAIITVTTDDGSFTDQCIITVRDGAVFREPYGGTNWNAPGRIEAENYDVGGEGYTYHDAEAANQGGFYRLDEGVDVGESPEDDGYIMVWCTDGEWTEYTVDIEPGTYNIVARAASHLDSPEKQTGTLVYSINGEEIGRCDLNPQSGDWMIFDDYVLENVQLEGGKDQVFRVSLINGNCNLNWFEFQRVYTAQEVADEITSVPAPEKDADKLTMPEIPDGFSIAIKSSSRPDVIALDGTITPPETDTEVELVFEITNLSDPTDTAETVRLKVTVPAKTPVPETFRVVFDSQGGTPETIVLEDVEANSTVTLPSAPVKDGWIFDGWWTEKDGQGEEFTEKTPVTGDITLYAKWVEDVSSQPGTGESSDPGSSKPEEPSNPSESNPSESTNPSEPTTSNPAESDSSTGEETSDPATGDGVSAAMYFGLAGVLILAVAGILTLKKKRFKNENF